MIHVSLGHCKQNKTYISIYITSQDQQLSVTLISDFLIIYLYFFTSEKIIHYMFSEFNFKQIIIFSTRD